MCICIFLSNCQHVVTAFDTVKKELSEHCLNNYFREDRETYLFTDAGKNAYDKENHLGRK